MILSLVLLFKTKRAIHRTTKETKIGISDDKQINKAAPTVNNNNLVSELKSHIMN